VPSPAVLQPLARAVVAQTTRASKRAGGQRTRFHATRSQAGTGARARRVVITVAGRAPGVQPRVVVTDREQARTQGLSQPMDWARGQAANARTDHQRALPSDRTACQRVAAHQCRVLLHAAASG